MIIVYVCCAILLSVGGALILSIRDGMRARRAATGAARESSAEQSLLLMLDETPRDWAVDAASKAEVNWHIERGRVYCVNQADYVKPHFPVFTLLVGAHCWHRASRWDHVYCCRCGTISDLLHHPEVNLEIVADFSMCRGSPDA